MDTLNDFIIEHLKKGNYEETLKLFEEKCSTKENSKICENFSNFLRTRETEKENDDNEDTKKIDTDLPLHSSTQSSEKSTQTKTLPQLLKSKECSIGKLIETSRTDFQIDVI